MKSIVESKGYIGASRSITLNSDFQYAFAHRRFEAISPCKATGKRSMKSSSVIKITPIVVNVIAYVS